MNVCPKAAIEMYKDEYGFLYPVIDTKKCVDCELCVKTCAFYAEHLNEPIISYAAVSKNTEQVMFSASGGFFTGIAEKFLEDGYVCGAELQIHQSQAKIKHILISEQTELTKLQGSKYVQSSLQEVLPNVRTALKAGHKVLFSGTPCQVAGVKSLFRKYDEQLYTIDIICHGVPSEQFLNDYLHYAKTTESEIKDIRFRDKRYGWGHKGSLIFIDNEIPISKIKSSYYKLFYDCEIFRDSCYQCPYGCGKRIGDLTIGDYWGVDKYNPELMQENGGVFSKKVGVSCVLINTERGIALFNKYGSGIHYDKVELENIKILNANLQRASNHTELHDKIMRLYKKYGYGAIEKWYISWKLKYNFKQFCKFAPNRVKRLIRRAINH